LYRLLVAHQEWCQPFLAAPSFFTVIDSYPIALLFPYRAGRSPQQIGKKGRDTGRWNIGIKLCWIRNNHGHVVAWDWAPMNVHDAHCQPLMTPLQEQSIVLADLGFRSQEGVPVNCKLCPRGVWNERMRVETSFSLLPVICDLKRLPHRTASAIQARVACLVALLHVLLTVLHRLHPEADPAQMSIAEFSL
jgi:hypothetical protein